MGTILKRLVNVIYLLAHIPIIFIIVYALASSKYWNYIDVVTYQARCKDNNQLVVLQGSRDGSPYHFTNKDIESYPSDNLETVRFYCKYYDQVQELKEQYVKAKSFDEETAANKAYWAFNESVPRSYDDNYILEEIASKSDYSYFWSNLLFGIAITLGYFAFLQVVKIIYQYVVFGKFSLHPYKGPKIL